MNLAWEWLQREQAIFGTFDVTRYRPKEHPNSVRVLTKYQPRVPCQLKQKPPGPLRSDQEAKGFLLCKDNVHLRVAPRKRIQI
jgi:hypothetical protein